MRFRNSLDNATNHNETMLLVILTGLLVVADGCAFGQELLAESAHEVVIVGGGIAGLSAAFHLMDQGVQDILVLEKSSRAGGRAVLADYLGKPQGSLKRIVQKLQLHLQEIPAPMDAALCDGRFYWGSDGMALMRIERSSLADYNRFLTNLQKLYANYDNHGEIPDFDPRSEFGPLDKITARQWFNQQGFAKIFQREYDVAALGLFGANLDEISALSVIPEFGFDYVGEKPVRRIASLDNRPGVKDRTQSYALVGGIGELTDALAKHLGSRLQLQATVTAVQREGRRFRVIFDDGRGKQHVALCRMVILATTASSALRIGKDVLGAEQKQILGQVRYGSAVVVSLASRSPIFGRAYCLAVLDNCFFADVYDGTWMPRHFGKPLPGGRIMTYVQITGHSSKDESVLEMPDQKIIARTLADLKRLFPRAAMDITEAKVRRVPEAFPVVAHRGLPATDGPGRGQSRRRAAGGRLRDLPHAGVSGRLRSTGRTACNSSLTSREEELVYSWQVLPTIMNCPLAAHKRPIAGRRYR